MAQPTYTEWKTLSTNADGLVPHTLAMRTLAALAVLASTQNPDGTPYVQ